MKTSLSWLNRYLNAPDAPGTPDAPDTPDAPVDVETAVRVLTGHGFPIEDQQQLPDGDTLLDVEVTSNRSDCQSHLGLARELAAGLGLTLNPPADDLLTHCDQGQPIGQRIQIQNQATDLCPVYTARVISNVRIAPSPDWLVQCLQAIGLRSVNNVVDVTNFVLFELGQPLHAFDLNLLNEKCITVRLATQGESFVAIDASKHQLKSNMLVIADSARPVAIAGVMGGLESQVTQSTTDILLESAIFDPLSVRRTSRALKLASDSSFRFERGVDPLGVQRASRRASQLIMELAGGELAPPAPEAPETQASEAQKAPPQTSPQAPSDRSIIRVGAKEPTQKKQVTLRVSRCNQLLGLDLPAAKMIDMLTRLQIDCQLNTAPGRTQDTITCQIPSFRLDLLREVDLIEEVARLFGLDNIPINPRIEIVAQSLNGKVAARQKLGQVLVAHGYHETKTYSLVSAQHAKPFLKPNDLPVLLEDEKTKAQPMLRPSLLPSLLACRKTNQDAGNTDIALYESASTWVKRDGQIIETNRLMLLRDAPDAQQAMRAMRGTVEEIFQQLAGRGEEQAVTFSADQANSGGAARQRLTIHFQGKPIGFLGVLPKDQQDLFDLQTPVITMQIKLDGLLSCYPPTHDIAPLPRFPAIERDLSVVVVETVLWQQIAHCVRASEPDLLETVDFLGTYRGKPIAKGSKSISFRMLFRDPTATLRHDQVDPQVSVVIDTLKEKVNAQLRS